MYEKVSEPIDVVVAFRRDRVEPMTFKWGTRHIQVQKINLVHTEKHGREKATFFSVSDAANNAYRLSFSSDTMKWMLEETAIM